jgi:hypothetical protein
MKLYAQAKKVKNKGYSSEYLMILGRKISFNETNYAQSVVSKEVVGVAKPT